jgi:hypothetical protein
MRFWLPALTLTLAVAPPASGQGRGTLPPLSFLGFEAGARLDVVSQQVQALGGTGLRCDRSRRDRAVSECRATLFDPVWSRPVALWLSAMDSATGVLTLSGPVTGEQLDGWKSELETAFGGVGARVQGPQWMLQWVRQGRMMRLTWRVDNNAKVASVSLIDGWVLDDWGRRRDQQAMPTESRTAKEAPKSKPPARDSASVIAPVPVGENPSPQ